MTDSGQDTDPPELDTANRVQDPGDVPAVNEESAEESGAGQEGDDGGG
jgi:hypothetical protein